MGLVTAPLRWLFVLVGAALGSYGGRIGAAAMRGEPVEPLLRFEPASLLRSDLVPGFLAVELAGKLLKLGPWSAAVVAAAASAAAAFAEGPLVGRGEDGALAPAAGDFGPVV